jgi:hypothetical protein
MNAHAVIAKYLVNDTPPSDYRVLFAAVLMQAKRDLLYAGGDKRVTPFSKEVRRWIARTDQVGGISFRMCCEALSLDEKATARYLETPYKGSRPWNGRNARRAEATPPSVRTCSKQRKRSSPSIPKSGYASYAGRRPSSSSPPMSI